MVIFKKPADLWGFLEDKRREGIEIGFVPTMGALHDGHVQLVARSVSGKQLTVVSIFVNPTQFNDPQDYANYPVSIEEDKQILAKAGCDVLFLPDVKDIYPAGVSEMQTYDFGYLETVLEGAHRPGHFKGVGQVVARLLHIVMPDNLYMGQKDYQQCMVIMNLLQKVETFRDIEMIICPTVREDDGLAMSSRNRRLTEPQRALAPLLYQCLVSIQAKNGIQSFAVVKKECTDILIEKGFDPEYVAIADANTLELLDDYVPGSQMVALIAARIGNIRLIDNMILG